VVTYASYLLKTSKMKQVLDLEKKAKELFAKNPHLNELTATDDGQFFANPSHASNHNRTVKGVLRTFKRGGEVSEKSLDEQVLEMDLTETTYKVKMDVAKQLNLSLVDKKEETLNEAIETYRKSLNK